MDRSFCDVFNYLDRNTKCQIVLPIPIIDRTIFVSELENSATWYSTHA
jgi:hypothetical protein